MDWQFYIKMSKQVKKILRQTLMYFWIAIFLFWLFGNDKIISVGARHRYDGSIKVNGMHDIKRGLIQNAIGNKLG